MPLLCHALAIVLLHKHTSTYVIRSYQPRAEPTFLLMLAWAHMTWEQGSMIYPHVTPIALAVVATLTSGKQSSATEGRTWHGCAAAAPPPAPAGGRYSRTTCLNVKPRAEEMGCATSSITSRSSTLSHRRVHGLACTVCLCPLDSTSRLCFRRRQSVGGVALLSRANRGGSSTPSTRKSTTAGSSPSSSDDGVGRSYHLIWSPSFGRNLLLSTAILFVLRYIHMFPPIVTMGDCHNDISTSTATGTVDISSSLSRLIRLLLLPLLSSSCCALQLLMNTIAGVGCAGFNNVLGPVRPIFLSFLVHSSVRTFPGPTMTGLGKWCSNTAISFLFALMPELLHIWNNNARRWLIASRANTTGNDANVRATVELDIPSMGCAACINKIDSTISGCNGVLSGRSWLEDDPKGGRARFVIATNSVDDVDAIISSVTGKVNGSGFSCRVDFVDVADKRPD